jgi:hypothetical protein
LSLKNKQLILKEADITQEDYNHAELEWYRSNKLVKHENLVSLSRSLANCTIGKETM